MRRPNRVRSAMTGGFRAASASHPSSEPSVGSTRSTGRSGTRSGAFGHTACSSPTSAPSRPRRPSSGARPSESRTCSSDGTTSSQASLDVPTRWLVSQSAGPRALSPPTTRRWRPPSSCDSPGSGRALEDGEAVSRRRVGPHEPIGGIAPQPVCVLPVLEGPGIVEQEEARAIDIVKLGAPGELRPVDQDSIEGLDAVLRLHLGDAGRGEVVLTQIVDVLLEPPEHRLEVVLVQG